MATLTFVAAPAASATSVPTTYSTPGIFTFTVPSGVTSLRFELYGAQGGRGGYRLTAVGGKGGKTVAVLPVSRGQVLQIRVGGRGGTNNPAGAVGGSNGGGRGGYYSGGGGGATDVRGPDCSIRCARRLLVAGGGGGGGGEAYNVNGFKVGGDGGGGGGLAGARGRDGTDRAGNAGQGGGGGTQSSGGGKGASGYRCASLLDGGTSGAKFVGGQGRQCGGPLNGGDGGGGGGGLYGGGGGGAGETYTSILYPGAPPDLNGFGGGGGGGGSSLTGPTGTTTPNVQTGHGKVVITAS